MKLRREYLITTGILLVLLIVTIVSGLFEGKTEEVPPLSSNSNTADGARALRLWLSEAGYSVSNQSSARFQIPAGTNAVLILEPAFIEAMGSAEWKTIDQWLENGGTLFLASREMWRALSSSPLKMDTSFTALQDAPILPDAPIFRAPPMTQPARLSIHYTLNPSAGQGQPLLATSAGIVALQMSHRSGSVILVTDSSFLTNKGLKEPGNAALALNLFALIPKGSKIWIDEWHHGDRGAERDLGYGPEAWLTSTPSGFAILFAAAVIFFGLLLAGRPFGRPVPLPRDQARRSALEYVTALANLNRRAGHHRSLMQSYRSAVKRAYGRRYRLDPGLPDAEYVDQLARFNPSLDGPALLRLLRRLDQKSFADVQVVQLAREAADWLAKLENR